MCRRVLLLLLLSHAAPSVAQPADAAALAREAMAEYSAGRYVEAGERFLLAHEASGRPSPLWNAAKAFARGGQYARAAALFRRYLALPDISAEERAEAEQELRLIEAEARAVVASSTTAARAAPPPAWVAAPAPAPARAIGWGSVASWSGAAAAVAVSVPLWIDAGARATALERALGDTQGGLIVGIAREDAGAERDAITAERAVGGALIGVAALAASLGLWLWLDG